jgi:spore germination cell wall hydrolase CwlJ-like protein
LTPVDRDAIARVAFAEAGDQGDSGLAGVVFVILNRLRSHVWGVTVGQVLNAHGQFEPVWRAGSDWTRLHPVSPQQQARVDTIVNLALDGRLPDPTRGAMYFQNPAIVSARVAAGEAPSLLVQFGRSKPSAIIGAHAFYPSIKHSIPSGASTSPETNRTIVVRRQVLQGPRGGAIFFPSAEAPPSVSTAAESRPSLGYDRSGQE